MEEAPQIPDYVKQLHSSLIGKAEELNQKYPLDEKGHAVHAYPRNQYLAMLFQPNLQTNVKQHREFSRFLVNSFVAAIPADNIDAKGRKLLRQIYLHPFENRAYEHPKHGIVPLFGAYQHGNLLFPNAEYKKLLGMFSWRKNTAIQNVKAADRMLSELDLHLSNSMIAVGESLVKGQPYHLYFNTLSTLKQMHNLVKSRLGLLK